MKNKSLADFTRKQLCLPALLAQDPADVLFELSCALERANVVPDPLPLFHSARDWRVEAERDQFGTTGYAIAGVPSVTCTTFALARTRPCTWRPGASPVYLVFLIAAAPHEPHVPAHLIEAVHRLVADPFSFREIHAAASGAGILAALERITVHPRGAHTPAATSSPQGGAAAKHRPG